jgi:predicted Zn-dependent peptidase
MAQSNSIKIEEFMLDNGLKVILNEDHAIPVVIIDVCYHVGSKNENPNRTGFAHLFEHLMYDGSTNVNRGEFDKYIYSAGGDDNAFTSEDVTNYYDLLPSNQLELALWLESDRMLQFGIRELSLTTQKEVVKEERKQSYENRPYGTVRIKMAELGYKIHPYRWPVIGSPESIENATLTDVRDFFETFYVPNNAVLAIVGDIDVNKTRKLIEKYFGNIPRGIKAINRPTEVEPQKTKQEREIVKDKVSLPGLFIGFHIPEIGTRETYALSLLSDILTVGESSRLYNRMVYTDQSAIEVSALFEAREDPGLLSFTIISSGKKDIADLEKNLFEELEKIAKSGVTKKELEKVKNVKEMDFIFGLETPQGRATSLALYRTLYNDANLINTEIDKYLEITTNDIQQAVKKYLIRQNSIVLYYIPVQK